MKRINSLQGIRAVGFLMIFLAHCGIGGLGGAGASVFFVLSGFLMAINYLKKEDTFGCSPKECIYFGIMKVKSLYPLHLLMIIPMLLLKLIGGFRANDILFMFLKDIGFPLIPNALLLQSWIPLKDFYFSFNGASWFLSVCLFLYTAFPVILKAMRKWSRINAIFSIALVYTVQLLLAHLPANFILISVNEKWFFYIFPIFRFGDFLIGCSAGFLFLNEKQHQIEFMRETIAELLTITVFICCVMATRYGLVNARISLSTAYSLGAALIIYAIAHDGGQFHVYWSGSPLPILEI